MRYSRDRHKRNSSGSFNSGRIVAWQHLGVGKPLVPPSASCYIARQAEEFIHEAALFLLETAGSRAGDGLVVRATGWNLRLEGLRRFGEHAQSRAGSARWARRRGSAPCVPGRAAGVRPREFGVPTDRARTGTQLVTLRGCRSTPRWVVPRRAERGACSLRAPLSDRHRVRATGDSVEGLHNQPASRSERHVRTYLPPGDAFVRTEVSRGKSGIRKSGFGIRESGFAEGVF